MQALTFHSSKCIKPLHRLKLELYLRCLQVATKGFFFVLNSFTDQSLKHTIALNLTFLT